MIETVQIAVLLLAVLAAVAVNTRRLGLQPAGLLVVDAAPGLVAGCRARDLPRRRLADAASPDARDELRT